MVLPTDPDDPTSGVRSTAIATQYRRRFLPVRPATHSLARASLPLAQRAPSLRSLRFQGNGTARDDEDHDDADNPNRAIGEWRTRDRVKTVSVLISLCMNIGIAPPDAPKPAHAAKLQAWLDPFSQAPNKALDAIAKALQAQYEVWQPRARYRLSTDPTLEDLKKQCCSLRKGAKEERILFHYNGHGVPRPTPSGELWVFNKGYTQYIPVSIYDLQTWLGAPCIFVYDCSAAGNILLSFNQFAAQRDAEVRQHLESLAAQHQQQQQLAASPPPSTADGAAAAAAPAGSAAPATSAPPSIHGSVAAPSLPQTPPVTFPAFSDCIQLAACGPNETLPWNPDLPADVFTACLTTPIQMALRWFLLQNAHARKHVTADMVARLPGRLNDRRTPLGELNWIFTAVTDTIAWSVLPRDMFRRLFRQDLMVAALFRNYLLAHRVMKAYGCHPMTTPALPADTDMHPMWAAWDMVVDLCIDQLPAMLAAERSGMPFDYVNATFFAEQLTAFEVWLNQGALTTRPPLQLPIVLQVLLSQYHRHRALIILSKFLDLGPWAVGEALQVGIFPYVLKLLQSPAPELKPVLVFIWTRILAVDPGCQQDLMKDNVFTYFLHVLSPTVHMATSQDVSEHRAMCAFVLSTLCHGYPTGQLACLQNSVLPLCLLYLQDHDDLLRQWSCICIAQVCHQNPEAILAAYHEGAHVKIAQSLADTVVEVRAAAVLALGTFLQLSSPQLQALAVEIVKALLPCMADPAAMVRTEVVIALSCFVTHHRPRLEAAVDRLLTARAAEAKAAATAAAAGVGPANARAANGTNARGASRLAALVSVPTADPLEALTSAVLKLLLVASVDPDEHVAMLARGMVDAIVAKSDLFPPSSTLFEQLRKYFARPQIRPAECRLPGSVRDLERRWTFERNRAQFLGSREAYPTVPRGTTWTQAVYISHPDGPVRAFRFHAFEDMLVSASSTHLSAWAVHTDKSDLGSTVTEPTGQAVWRLENNSPAAAITALDLINEDGYSLLGVGTNDGVVRLWRDVVPYRSAYSDFRPPPTVAASWRALPDLIKPKSAGTSSGVVLKWISALSSLAVAGDARTVKVWDLERATCLRDVHTQSAMPVAAVTCDVLRAPHVLVIGNGDGAVRVLDMRAGPTQAVVMTLREHRAWVVGVDVQQGSPWDTDNPGAVGTAGAGGLGLHIVSASAHGDVKCWDLRRGGRSVRSIDAYANASLATLAVHPYVPLAAAGSAAGQVKLLDVALEPAVGEDPVRATITHYDGFLGQRLGKVTATAFHPLVPTLAVGAGGTGAVQGSAGAVVSVYRATGG
ncbi:hypothetical protein AMAG_12123 [Allomyces macrogynus ATCC 38327]|uniref:Raptor N-terminal CASPase-like domain-containing protein n=1 Tax=Allomyces macrogynus (strain ATCC 38327) TaxID=578462 RepID=A0A0L0SX43_ALLM3|nr:hypothetical protein AMAG_12123 [Allomyces macrogynus ATCC 38327]|eukprot:KNE67046.1 hypothetical protein AMAG_12123 [Allomyces macrogynus ATCC 38327]